MEVLQRWIWRHLMKLAQQHYQAMVWMTHLAKSMALATTKYQQMAAKTKLVSRDALRQRPK